MAEKRKPTQAQLATLRYVHEGTDYPRREAAVYPEHFEPSTEQIGGRIVGPHGWYGNGYDKANNRLARLEKNGLVKRRRSRSGAGWSSTWYLTDEGRAAIDA